MTWDVWTFVRMINIVLYGAVLSGIIMHWGKIARMRLPLFGWGLWIVLAGGAWATVQAAFLGYPGGFRLIALLIGLAGLTFSFYALPIARWWRARRRSAS